MFAEDSSDAQEDVLEDAPAEVEDEPEAAVAAFVEAAEAVQ